MVNMRMGFTLIFLLAVLGLRNLIEASHITRKFADDPAREGQRWMTYFNKQPWKATCWDTSGLILHQLACTVDMTEEIKAELAFSLTACILASKERPPLFCPPAVTVQACAESHGYA